MDGARGADKLDSEGIPDVPTPANSQATTGENSGGHSEAAICFDIRENRDVLEPQHHSVLANQAASSSSGSASNAQSLEKLFQRMNILSKEGRWVDLASVIRSHEELMVKRCGDLEQFILSCDPAKHSAAVIFALHVLHDIAEKKSLASAQERVFEILRNFLLSQNFGREQLLTVTDIYCQLFRKLHDYCINAKKYEIGLSVTALGIDAIADKGKGVLTSLHGNLFNLAIHAQKPESVVNYLEDIKEILNENMVPQQVSGSFSINTPHIDYRHVLFYLYYGADVAFASGDIKRATLLLYNLITFPATEVVPIMISGHKKYVLYQLLINQDVAPPLARSPCLNRAWRHEGELYNKIINAVNSKDNPIVAVESLLFEHLKAFEKDGTVESIRTLITSLTERSVLKVAKCFSTIRLRDLVRRAHLKSEEEAKELCEKLRQEGKLTVEFNGDVVLLHLCIHKVDESEFKKSLNRLEDIRNNLANVHCGVQCHPIFLSRTLRVSGTGYLDDEGLSMSMANSQAAQKD